MHHSPDLPPFEQRSRSDFIFWVSKRFLYCYQLRNTYLFAEDVNIVHRFKLNATGSITENASGDLHSIGRWRSKRAMKFLIKNCGTFTHDFVVSPGFLSIDRTPVNVRPVVRDLGLQYPPEFNPRARLFPISKI